MPVQKSMETYLMHHVYIYIVLIERNSLSVDDNIYIYIYIYDTKYIVVMLQFSQIHSNLEGLYLLGFNVKFNIGSNKTI